MTRLMTTGAPSVGISTPGVCRDTHSDGIFQSTELKVAQGNLCLSLTTNPVPEPSSWARMALGLIAGAAVGPQARCLTLADGVTSTAA